MSITCPRCKTVNKEGSVFCTSCGYSLEGLAPSAPTPPVSPAYVSQSPRNVSANVPITIETRYGVLRAISTFLTVLAWIFLVAGGLFGILMGMQEGAGMGLLFFLAGILVGGLLFSIIKAYAELLQIAIDIEENTRLTAELLERK